MKNYNKFYYVVHSDKGTLTDYVNETETKLYLVDKVADSTIATGLVEWVIKKTS